MIKKVRILKLSFVLLLCSLTAKAQDTEFWFTVPHFSEQIAGGVPLNMPAFLAISNGTLHTANVKITRYNGGSPIVTNTTIAPGQLYKMDFSDLTAMKTIENPRGLAGSVTKFGMHITSDVKVNAYYMANSNDSRDIFALKGKAALGTSFYVPMQSDNYDITGAYAGAFDQIDIVATEDNTTITIVPKAAVQINHPTSSISPAGTPITITLNKGETFKVMEATINSGSLAGTSIVSNKPIAVTVSEDLVGGDTSGDQIVPISSVGKRYVVAKGYSTAIIPGKPALQRERVYMVATANGTSINVNGTVAISGMNAGDIYVYTFENHPSADAVYVVANEPIYCFQRSGFNEQGSALLPSMYSISQNKLTYFQVTAQQEKAFVVFSTGTEAGFTITYNGATYPLNVGTPTSISGISEWKCARFDLPLAANNGVVTISNPQSKFSLGYIGANTSANIMTFFGYLSQFGTLAFDDTTYLCDGSSIVLDAGYALSYDWTLPNGSHLTTATISVSDTGLYSVTVDQDPFLVTASTRVLHRFEGASIVSSPENSMGTGTFTYTANHGLYSSQHLSYTWLVDGVPVGTNPTFTTTWGAKEEKLITLQMTDTVLNCTKIDSLRHFPAYIEICDGRGATFTASITNGGSTPAYQWRKNGVNIAGATNATYSYTPQNGDTISCRMISNASCAKPDTVLSHNTVVFILPAPTLTIKLSSRDTAICSNTTVVLNLTTLATAVGGDSVQFSTTKSFASLINPATAFPVNSGTTATVYVRALNTTTGCYTKEDAIDSIKITINPLLPVSIAISASETSACAGTQITFNVISTTNPGTVPVYVWKKNTSEVIGNGTPLVYVPSNGDIIHCELTSNVTCANPVPAISNNIKMTIIPKVVPSITIEVVN